MSYLEEQLKKAIGSRNELFEDPGGGIYNNQSCEYVLEDQTLNIWENVRDDVMAYFYLNSISFWESINMPSGYLLSSQIACINHLYFIRLRQDVATAVLQGVDKNVKNALRIKKHEHDIGFVVFEENGQNNYLHERSRIRGAHSTSIDAVMLGEMKDGTRKLFLISWNYAECYSSRVKAKAVKGGFNVLNYTSFIQNSSSPFNSDDLVGLSIDPYFQLMRQTLLAEEMIKANEYGATDYCHLFVAPSANQDLLGVNVASRRLAGSQLHETWSNLLKTPGRYIIVDPHALIQPAIFCIDINEIFSYLKKRYWD